MAGTRAVLDTSTERGKHIESRLFKDVIIWLVTTGSEPRAHAVPVWFLWDGASFLIYSLPGQKVRDIETNPEVAMHLNTTPTGGSVVRIDGTATRLRGQPPADKVPDYISKYAALIERNGWTPESFSAEYHVALGVRPTRVRTG